MLLKTLAVENQLLFDDILDAAKAVYDSKRYNSIDLAKIFDGALCPLARETRSQNAILAHLIKYWNSSYRLIPEQSNIVVRLVDE